MESRRGEWKGILWREKVREDGKDRMPEIEVSGGVSEGRGNLHFKG